MKVKKEGTLAASLCRSMVDVGVERGLERAELLAVLDTRTDDELQFDRRMPMANVAKLWELLMRRLRDPALPLDLARRARPEGLQVLGFALLTSTSTREAIARVIRFGKLLCDAGYWELIETNDEVIVAWQRHDPPTLGVRVDTETSVAHFFFMSRLTIACDYAPLRVFFRHKAPSQTSAHREFFGCPVEFAAEMNGFSMPREMLNVVPRNANPEMNAFFDVEAQRQLTRLDSETKRDRTEQVREAIGRELANGEPAMPVVARRLGMSERSLRRYLRDEGVGFRELVDRVRRKWAGQLLDDAQLSLSEIAFLLGFSEVSAFSRAFKRWFGSAPSEYRRGLDAVEVDVNLRGPGHAPEQKPRPPDEVIG